MVNLVKPCVEQPSAWREAVRLVARWFADRPRTDRLMEEASKTLGAAERANCQHLVFGVIRHAGRIEAALDRIVAHPPRFVTRSVLFVSGFELIDAAADGPRIAKIVHHAVGQAKTLASPAEARLVNAVARKLAASLGSQAEPPPLAPAEALAEHYSHPLWLVRRWLALYGAQPTRALLAWNQSPAPIHARWRGPAGGGPGAAVPDWLRPAAWPGFHEVPSGRWADVEGLLRAGLVYLQDPATRLAVDLLAPVPGESVLDLCAAPGGKSLLIADRLGGSGLLVAWDLPGGRIDRLKENLAGVSGVRTEIVTGDALVGAARLLKERGLPLLYPAVMLDAPCSNTGVMRHRIDVKWRIQQDDFPRHARQQEALLESASQLVAPGGRLVYSTCSIDPGENERVAEAFAMKAAGRFEPAGRRISHPWIDGHDGAGAFLFRRLPG